MQGDSLSTRDESAVLAEVSPPEDCERLFENDPAPELEAHRLSGGKMLVNTLCWMAAYNLGHGYWVANDRAPYQATAVTYSGTDYARGLITAFAKGRGIGDCISNEQWAWDGSAFKPSLAMTSGMCKEIQAGGAWDLPTYVARVKYKN